MIQHTDLRQAAQRALSLLDSGNPYHQPVAANVLRTALEQPEQEPVALVIDGVLVKSALPEKYTGHLYTHQPAAQPEPFEYWNAVEGWVKIDEVREHFDSVGCGTIYKTAGEGRAPLYTSPAQRPWQGLTEDDLVQIGVATGLERAAVEMISNKLKERNNG